MRYNTPISVVTSVTYIILSQMVGAIAIFASSVAVSTVFSASAIWCSVIIGLTSTAYTAMGGIRGVVWADCLQAVLTISAPVVIVAKVMWDAKSGDTRIQPLSEILTYKYFYNYCFDLTTDETIWSGLLATTPTFFNRICLDQGTAQRYFASRNQKEAKWTVIAGTLMTCVFYGLLACAGAALVCRYRGCDPVLSGSIKKFDQWHSSRPACFYCGIRGHISRYCHHRQQDERGGYAEFEWDPYRRPNYYDPDSYLFPKYRSSSPPRLCVNIRSIPPLQTTLFITLPTLGIPASHPLLHCW
ncbi:sodium/iodide cotransporter-like [Rhipicephalus microplus]|uniref:sodium/iodide cotransporter-like n=1 Tax=Rhipicephalus microplus TaxID=6941 RepID=UPI003F6CD4F7